MMVKIDLPALPHRIIDAAANEHFSISGCSRNQRKVTLRKVNSLFSDYFRDQSRRSSTPASQHSMQQIHQNLASDFLTFR
jgi:hypothetical protein